MDNKVAMAFPPSLVAVGYVLIATGIYGLISVSFLFAVLILFGIFFSQSTVGVILDPTQGRLKDYGRYFWITFGKWQDLGEFPFLTALAKNMVARTTSRPMNTAVTHSEQVIDLCLLNQNHRKKIIVKRLPKSADFKTEAGKLAAFLNVEYVDYNPVISQASRARRR